MGGSETRTTTTRGGEISDTVREERKMGPTDPPAPSRRFELLLIHHKSSDLGGFRADVERGSGKLGFLGVECGKSRGFVFV